MKDSNENNFEYDNNSNNEINEKNDFQDDTLSPKASEKDISPEINSGESNSNEFGSEESIPSDLSSSKATNGVPAENSSAQGKQSRLKKIFSRDSSSAAKDESDINQGPSQSQSRFQSQSANNSQYSYNNNSADYAVPPYGTYTPKKKKGKRGLIIFLVILAVALAMIIAASSVITSFINTQTSSGNYMDYGYNTSSDHISVINIQGTISSAVSSGNLSEYNQTWLLEIIDSLKSDYSNKALVLYINTPGGSVYETDEVYLKLLEYKKETGNPIYVSMGSSCTSGGYYIACAADKLFANRNTTTGSIGVTMGTHIDISQLLANYGISTTTLTSGENKAMGSIYDPMTDEQKAIFQSIIDESYEQFLSVVSDGRNMDIETLRPLCDGRVYTASQALDNGLIDGIATFDETLNQLLIDLELNSIPVYTYQYQPSISLSSLLSGASTGQSNSSAAESELAAALKLAQESSNEVFYLPAQ